MRIVAADAAELLTRFFEAIGLHHAIGVRRHGEIRLIAFVTWQKYTYYILQQHAWLKIEERFAWLEYGIALHVTALADAHLQGYGKSLGVNDAVIGTFGGIYDVTCQFFLHV